MNVGDDVVIAGKIRAYSKSLGLLVVELPNKEIISVSDKAIRLMERTRERGTDDTAEVKTLSILRRGANADPTDGILQS